MATTSNEEFTDIYLCIDPQDAARLVHILGSAAIEAIVRDRGSSAFPTNVGHTGAQIIAVAEHQRESARALIHDAIADGVVSGDGELV